MRDEFDDILKNRLHDVEIHEGLPDWESVERSLIAAEKKEKKRKAFFLFSDAYKYAAVGLIMIGLGYIGYKLIVHNTQNKYVAGNVNSEVVQKSSNTVTAEGMGVEKNTAHVEYNPVKEVSSDSEEKATVNETLSAIPSSSLPTNETVKKNNIETTVNEIDRYHPLFSEIPVIASLLDTRNSIIEENEYKLYDIDEYLTKFNELYGDDSDGNGSKWHQILMADALAINRSSKPSEIGDKNSLCINSYYGNLLDNNRLVYKLDNVLLEKYTEIYGDRMTEQDYERLVNVFPVSFSLGVSRDIGTKMGIESGLLYSFLKSFSGKKTWTSVYFEQKVQYIGVPVTIYYSLLPENSNWDIDIRGGITAEKAISAIGTTTIYENYVATESSVNDDIPSNIMLSGHAGVGFGYSLFKSFGLYAEPAFEYYFYTKGQPVSYKTDNPFRFNVPRRR